MKQVRLDTLTGGQSFKLSPDQAWIFIQAWKDETPKQVTVVDGDLELRLKKSRLVYVR